MVHEVRHSPSPVVAVIAPAGYGKTAVLTQWACLEERKTAWATITTDDDDPALLLTVLTAAFAQVSEPVAQLSLAALDPVAAPHRGAVALAAALRQTVDPFVVFVDDVQAAADPACEAILATILAAVPQGSAVALASRRALPFLARQRVERRVHQVGVRHLRLDLAGARRIAEESGVKPSDADLEEWLRRCDGWPTGLILSVLAFQDGRGRLSGGDQDVVDYLSRECVTELPEKLIVFLTRTSVLSRLSVAACNTILESVDAARKLRELNERYLFLIATDSGEFRCPELIREYLLEELLTREPEQAARLHARAADWNEAATPTHEAEALRNRRRAHISGPHHPPLTPAELRLIPLLQSHLTLAQIGELLFVSRNTVSTQAAAVYRKLGVRTRKEAVDAALHLGLLGDDPVARALPDLASAAVPQPPSSRNGATGSMPS